MARNFGAGGTDDRILMTNPARLYPFSHKHTFAGWCYRVANPTSNTWRFAQESDNQTRARWYLACNNNGSQGAPSWRWYLFSGGTYKDSWIWPWPAINTWHHVAVSHDTTNIGTPPICYNNGVPQSLTRYDNWDAGVDTSESSIRLGGAVGGGSGWPGKGQNMAYWNDILSPAEIMALYRGVSPHRIRTGKLQWHYPCFQTTEEGDWAGGRAGERFGTTVEPGPVPSGPLLVV